MRLARSAPAALLAVASAVGCATAAPRNASPEALRLEVLETERAFAKTMADRDHAAFTTFLAAETVFFSGERPLRGAEAVAAWWKKYYEGPAPFSWEPAQVEVLASGTLALSTGPVRDPSGKVVATFSSIWRREGPGRWRIVFDKGSPACPKEP